MSKLTFNVKDYNTNQYSVETIDGEKVTIVSVDEKRNAVFGFYGKDEKPCYWDLQGNYFPEGAVSSDSDLVLIPKRVTVHVNITRNKYGKIDCYASTKGKARVYRGSTLLKYLTIEVDE